ncbi:MAG: carbohydrate ABC transporter substrate-binding protein [Hydrogenibacillus sp.]|nr:carbohydrate ABC transporter substrate-binding protein [Hydrogenibacillus sp.]
MRISKPPVVRPVFPALRSLALAMTLIAVLLAGCSASRETSGGAPKTLRILGDTYGLEVYNAVFSATHENVDIELIDAGEAMRAAIEEARRKEAEDPEAGVRVDYVQIYRDLLSGPEAPDVVVLFDDLLTSLVDEGLLMPLDGYIERDRFPLDRLAPGLVESLRERGKGELYGLAPRYSSSALAYNKDHFDAHQLPYPTDDMTWDELFDLAEALTGDKNGRHVAGFSLGQSFGNLFFFAELLLKQQGINFFDEEGRLNPINTPERRAIYARLVDLERRGVIAKPQHDWFMQEVQNQSENGEAPAVISQPAADGPFSLNDLINERASMQIVNVSDVDEIVGVLSGRYSFGDQSPPSFAWDLVPFPHPADHPDIGGPLFAMQIFAINAVSGAPDLAWDYIRLVMSEKVAQSMHSADGFSGLKAYSDLNNRPEYQNLNIQAFGMRKPLSWIEGGTQNIDALSKVYEALNKAMDQIRHQNVDVDTALREAEQQAQALVQDMQQSMR